MGYAVIYALVGSAAKQVKRERVAGMIGVFGAAFLWLIGFKILAYWAGPSGVGLFSQLRQIAQAATIAGSLGGTNAVVQGLASRSDELHRMQFRNVASRTVAVCGALVALFMLIFAQPLASLAFSSENAHIVRAVQWVGFATLLNTGGTYIAAVLNGYRRYLHLAAFQISGPLVMVIALFVLVYTGGGGEVSPEIMAILLMVCFGVSYVVGLFIAAPVAKSVRLKAFRLPVSEMREFLWFALSNMAAAFSATIALLLVRSWIISEEGLEVAGLFEAGWTLTYNYMTIFLTACSTLYLPALTAQTSAKGQRTCMLAAAYLVLAGVVCVSYLLVAYRLPLIHLLYSQAFDSASEVVGVLSFAIMLRGVSWVFGTLIVATRKSRILILSDLFFNTLLVFACWISLHYFKNLSAVCWAIVAQNLLYLVFVIEYACHENDEMRRREIWPFVMVAILPLAMCEIWNIAHTILLSGGLVVGWLFQRYRQISRERMTDSCVLEGLS